jgi:NADPH-dependent 2,4-dienoyl-CoA reductase/sulfur reductase-like enzyme
MKKVVVVGGSLAGLRAVEALRREGFEGQLSWIGAESHAPYDRPPLSKQVLRGEWPADKARLRFDPSALGVTLTAGSRAVSLDARACKLALSNGQTLDYDGLVIATGADARRLPSSMSGTQLAGVHVLRTLDDALALHAELAKQPAVCVIGAGFIGLEVASSCRALGLSCTVIEPLAVPLETKIGLPMASLIAAMHRDAGVDLRCGVGVAALEGGERVERVRLTDGATVEAQLVVVGIGVTANVAWLEGSGVAIGDGVECDARCASSVNNIVAAGDVARWPNAFAGERMRVEHWTHAVEMAAHAARRLLRGREVEPFTPVPYFWSDQLGVKIQFAGHTRGGADADELRVVEGSLDERKLIALFGRKDRVVGVLALGKPARLVHYRKRIADGMRWDEAVPQA